MTQISWKTKRSEFELITQIADRAVAISARSGIDYPMQDALMDLIATHANGCKLKLAELKDADAFTFTHDVLGIRRHLDRSTGKLKDCFTPRCAA